MVLHRTRDEATVGQAWGCAAPDGDLQLHFFCSVCDEDECRGHLDVLGTMSSGTIYEHSKWAVQLTILSGTTDDVNERSICDIVH